MSLSESRFHTTSEQIIAVVNLKFIYYQTMFKVSQDNLKQLLFVSKKTPRRPQILLNQDGSVDRCLGSRVSVEFSGPKNYLRGVEKMLN